MEEEWTQSRLQQFIDEEIEEGLTLEYKGAGSLSRSVGKKKEITKDISAMANSTGGIIVYGINEYDDKDKEHLPEKLDAISRTEYSKEWLEQIINTIRPRIKGVIIHSVDLNTVTNGVAYVVDIPKSDTAHQARDNRYYLRHNFLSDPMEDYQIRDVMNRGEKPDVSVKFNYKNTKVTPEGRKYRLQIHVENHGNQVINNYKIVFSIPNGISHSHAQTLAIRINTGDSFTHHSTDVLFPEEALDIISVNFGCIGRL